MVVRLLGCGLRGCHSSASGRGQYHDQLVALVKSLSLYHTLVRVLIGLEMMDG